MSTPDRARTLDRMADITREKAAELAGVSERTINRWSERGLLTVTRPNGPWGVALYDSEEVIAVALRATVDVPLPAPETDISG